MRTSARLLAATGALVVAGLVVPATASAQTACEEMNRNNGPLTGPVHTVDVIGEQTPAAPVTELILHDTVEPLTCED